MAEPCFNAKVLAAALLWNSETFAKEMVQYSNELNTARVLWWKKSSKQLERIVDEKIAIALDVRVLRWEAWDAARIKLTKTLANRWYTLKQATDFFDKLENISLKDIDEYGSLLFEKGDDFENVTQAMDALREAVATHIITESHLKRKYWVQEAMLTVWEWWKIAWTKAWEELVDKYRRKIVWREKEIDKDKKWRWMRSWKEAEEAIEKHTKENKALNARLAELTKLVEEIVPISNRWTETLNEIRMWDTDVESKVNNYIIWSVFIWQYWDWEVLKVINDLRLKWTNYLPPLTIEDIDNINDVNTLLERVYANAWDIANSLEIRKALKAKLYKLFNDWNGTLFDSVLLYSDWLMNTLLYCDSWDSFSDVLRYHRIWSIAQDFLETYKWVYTRKHNKTIFNELKAALDSEEFIKNIGTAENPKKYNFMWIEFTWEDFLRLVYTIAWDDNLNAAVRYWRNIPDEKIYNYVRLKLFGWTVNKAQENINYLIKNFVKPYKYQDLTAIAFKTTSSIPIEEADFWRLTFVTFDKRIKAENVELWSTYWARAEFNEALADTNTLTVSVNWVPNNRIIDLSDWPSPSFPLDTKYVVIPNWKYASDEWFKNQIKTLTDLRSERVKELKKEMAIKNKQWENTSSLQKAIDWYSEDIIIVYPKWKESWQYFIERWTNKIKYKTTNSRFFNELSRDIAASTFNKATINLSENTEEISKQLEATSQAKEKDLNEKAFNFWRHFLWVEWEQLTDRQVLNRLSAITGIPFKMSEMWPERWSLAQDVAFHRYSTSANYYTDVSPVNDINKDIAKARKMRPDEVARELTNEWYRVNENAVIKNIWAIREAMVGMATAPTLADYIWFKWVKIWLATNPWFKSFDLNQAREVFKAKNPTLEIATMLFWEKQFSKNELLQAESYLWDLTDAIVDEFAMNLIGAWYQLPLSSPKQSVLHYLKWGQFYWDKFTQDFIFKNWIADDEWTIMQIFSDNIPSRTTLWSDITKDSIKQLASSKRRLNIRIKQINSRDRMLPSWHNSYWAAVWWRPVSRETEEYLLKMSAAIPRSSRPDIEKKLQQFFTEDELKTLWREFVDNMVDWKWLRVWWRYINEDWNRLFRFSTDAAQWTAEHETVHAFMDMFYTDEMRADLINYTIENHWKEVADFAKRHWYSDLSVDKQAEEWLAENFINYVAKMEWRKNLRWWRNLPKRIINAFKRLYEKVKLLTPFRDNIEKFYNDIYTKNRRWYSIVDRTWNSELYRRIDGALTDKDKEQILSFFNNTKIKWLMKWDRILWGDWKLWINLEWVSDDEIWDVINRISLISDFEAKWAKFRWWIWKDYVPQLKEWARRELLDEANRRWWINKSIGDEYIWKKVNSLLDDFLSTWYSPVDFTISVWNYWKVIDGKVWLWFSNDVIEWPGKKIYFYSSDWRIPELDKINKAEWKESIIIMTPWGYSIEIPLKNKSIWAVKLFTQWWYVSLWDSITKLNRIERAKLGNVLNRWRFVWDNINEIWEEVEREIYERQRAVLWWNGAENYRRADPTLRFYIENGWDMVNLERIEKPQDITESDVIKQILNNYETAVEWYIKDWKLTVKKSQDLKQQAMYAINTAIEDLIFPKYWEVLTNEQKQTLLWLWYNLKIVTNKDDLQVLKDANKKILEQFNKWWSSLAKKINMNFSNIEEMDSALMKRWKVYVERNWNMLAVDVHDELINSIRNIPDWAWEFTNLRSMTDEQLRSLTNRHAYTLLKLVDVVKMNINRWNFYTNLMMQLNPQLRNVRNWLNFFQAFKAVKIWNNAYIPKILQRNITAWYLWKWTWLTDSIDEQIKSWILQKIYDQYASKWITMTSEWLETIVNEEIAKTSNEWYKDLYLNAFAPYANIIWLPRDVYSYLNKAFSAETASVRKLLNQVIWPDWDIDNVWWNMLNMNVTLNDGSTVKVWDIVGWTADAESWKQRLFWEMNKTEEWLAKWEYIDEFWVAPEDKLQDAIKWTHAWYNDVKFISKNEWDMITSLVGNARKLLQKDTNTNQFVEFDYMIWWQNDILRALIEDCTFNTWKISWNEKFWLRSLKKFVNWTLKITWLNTRLNAFDSKSWSEIQQAYEVYYAMPLKSLKRVDPPKDKIRLTALEMAKYFKTAEEMLGSKDWARWVAMNSSTIDWHSINRAFWNIWSIVRNITRADWVFSLMNKIWNNQILWLFRFAKEWDSAYHPILKRWWSNTTKARFLITPWASWYQEYSRASRVDQANEFNQIFWTNLDVNQATIVLQALWWVKFISDWTYSRFLNDLLWNITNTLVLTRAVMSYPLQLFTVYPQLFAYSVKADWIKRWLWVENLSEVRDIRKEYWVLEWTYVELSVPSWLSDNAKKIYRKWFLESDNPQVAELWLELDDWVLWLYGKVTDYTRKIKNPEALSQLIDSTRDNANNIIDAAMAQTFKWLAFVKALQTNDYITFMNPKMFKEFMENPQIAQEIKDELLKRVDMYSNRIFQDMLWIWFTWLDRVYTAWWVSDIMGALLSVINFKWAWWTNIWRQTFEKIWTTIKIAWHNWADVDATVKQIMAMPEFTTFSEALFADALWMRKMWKYTDTWKWEDESDVSLMDFVLWAADNIEFVSQQWQGLASFWFSRLISWWYEWATAWFESWETTGESVLNWALWLIQWFNSAFIQNFWRNWKPWALISKALLIWIQNWSPAEWWNYLANEWYKVSWGTMRYLIEEWESAYWDNTPITIERWRIPSMILWENYSGSDTAFAYKMRTVEQIEYMKQMLDWTNDNATRWGAAKELFTNFLNSSQYLKTINYLLLMPATGFDYLANDWFLTWSKVNSYNYNIRWIENELIENSPTFKTFYETGKIVPPNWDAINTLLDHYMKPNYIGWYKAYQWIQNFLDYWHINWKKDKQWEDNWSFYDKPLEELYARIEEDNPGALKKFMNTFNSMFLWDAESDEARKFTFSWFVTALKNYQNDPEYKKYVASYYKWLLNYDYYNTLAIVAQQESDKRKALWLSNWLEKVSSSDLKKLSWVIWPINRAYLEAHFDQMNRADKWLVQNEMYSRVADELWEWLAKKYFSRQEEEDWNWAKTGNEVWVLSPNIRNQLKEYFEFQDYVDRWLYNDALTFTAIMTKRQASNDKSWLIRAAMVEDYYRRIQESDWSPEMKASALAQLIENNDDVFTYNSEFAEKYPEQYDVAKWYLNSLMHDISKSEVMNLNNIAILKDALVGAFKDSKKSSNGKIKVWSWWSWWAISSWLNLIWNLAKKMAALKSNWWWAKKSYTNAKFKILPVAISWVYPISKNTSWSGKIDFNKEFVSRWYDPKTKTLWPITPPKKNKAVKGTTTRKLTQKEENELDLI